MARVSETEILEALKTVKDPDQGEDVVALNMVSGLAIRDGNVQFSIEVDPARGAALEPLRQAAERAVAALPGVLSATAVLTAHHAGGHHAGGHHHGGSRPQARPEPPRRPEIPGVRAIVAVASGKGGVGKSTTAVNLALALKSLGLSVGLLDADIYGPSMPRLLAISGRPSSTDGRILQPMEKYGIKVMSIGFMVAEDTPMIWRGPMVQSALQQMLRDVAWGPLDILVVDMPPGTGDAQLTMAQQVPLAGAVIVSTPQDIALIDARKGLNMFRRVEVPVLGIVENMSTFVCPNCGHESHIFGHGGAEREAAALGVDFLGAVPLDIAIRTTSDEGTPIVVTEPDGPHAASYRGIARRVWAQVSGAAQRPAPRIVVQ